MSLWNFNQEGIRGMDLFREAGGRETSKATAIVQASTNNSNDKSKQINEDENTDHLFSAKCCDEC